MSLTCLSRSTLGAAVFGAPALQLESENPELAALRCLAGHLAKRLTAASIAPEPELRATLAEVQAALATGSIDTSAKVHHSFAARVHRQPANIFDQLVPLMQDREATQLCQGIPPPECFPLHSMRFTLTGGSDAAENSFELSPADTFSAQRYAPFAQGPLKEWIKTQVATLHTPKCPDWGVSLSAGSMSGVDLAIGLFLGPGDTVIVEEYTFMAAVDAFMAAGVRMVPVSGDAEGLQPEALEAAIAAEVAAGRPRPRALYVIPVGQNPTGTKLVPARYTAIYEICRDKGLVIIEDDAYFFLQHNAHDQGEDDDQSAVAGLRGLATGSFLSVDEAGIVLRLDTFSKVLAPGFRLGWVTGSQCFIKAYDKLAWISSQNGCSLSMMCLAKMLAHWNDEGLGLHVSKVQLILRRRCRALIRACVEHLTDVATWKVPCAGMYLWVQLLRTGPIQPEELIAKMKEYKVVVLPGCYCMTDRTQSAPFIRISYVAPEETYDAGIRRLREVCDSLAAKKDAS